jgi:hypothetical protein
LDHFDDWVEHEQVDRSLPSFSSSLFLNSKLIIGSSGGGDKGSGGGSSGTWSIQ